MYILLSLCNQKLLSYFCQFLGNSFWRDFHLRFDNIVGYCVFVPRNQLFNHYVDEILLTNHRHGPTPLLVQPTLCGGNWYREILAAPARGGNALFITWISLRDNLCRVRTWLSTNDGLYYRHQLLQQLTAGDKDHHRSEIHRELICGGFSSVRTICIIGARRICGIQRRNVIEFTDA